MDARYSVRRLRAEDWEARKRIRLTALRAEPLAFGSTLERELAYPDDRWRETARRDAGPGADAAFLAFAGGPDPVGMGGSYAEEGRWHVIAMWVVPPHRGRGVGRKILEAILAHRAECSPSAPLDLQVNPEQAAALRLYERAGFHRTGELSPLGHHPPARVERMVWVPARADAPSKRNARGSSHRRPPSVHPSSRGDPPGAGE